MRRWAITGAVVAVLAVLLAVVLVAVNGDDDNGAPSRSSTSSSTGSSTTTTTVADTSTAVWPYASSQTRYHDPVDAARAFAEDFAGFTNPIVGEFQQGDTRSGEVEIRPVANGPVTTVFVRQLGAANDWWILGSATRSIQIMEPKALATVTSPLHLKGVSTAFEANVNTEIREDGSTEALGKGFVMGGSNGDLGPFDGTLSFRSPTAAAGALVMRTFSMKDGAVWEASVLRVRLGRSSETASCTTPAPPKPGAEQTVLKVFFTCGEGRPPVALTRIVPKTTSVLRAAVASLLEGPTADERAAGFTSFFSSATRGMVKSVNLSSDGAAIIDFDDLRPVIPNASASAGSALLLGQLDATVFQFSSVRSVVYRINGDCETFTDWLQIGGCDPRKRASS